MSDIEDDQRAAVGFSVTLSGQLVQAAVTLLTVQGAYISYALASRETAAGFEVIAGLAAIVFIFSIYFSGKAVTAARNAGFARTWSLDAGRLGFNLQAILLILGVLLLAAMIFLSGVSKESDTTKKLSELVNQHSVLEARVIAITRQLDLERKLHADYSTAIDQELNTLREAVARQQPPQSVAPKPIK